MNVLDSMVLNDLPKNHENIKDNPLLNSPSRSSRSSRRNSVNAGFEMVSIKQTLNDEKHEKDEKYDKHDKNENMRFILVCSRDLDEEELELFKLYGKLLKYDDCYINIPLEKLIKNDPSIYYIAFDIRQKNHRSSLSKELHNNIFHIVAIVHKWEEMDDFIDDANCENCLSSLPLKQAFKKDFDRLLLEKKIREPSCFKNIIRIAHKAINGWQKD
jgi:hypothetical protein